MHTENGGIGNIKKRIISLGSALLFFVSYGLVGLGLGTAGVAAAAEPAADGILEHENGEVFVSYTDGSFEVIAFETGEGLAAGLEALEQDEAVAYIQPNYSYAAGGLSTTDALSGQQWALSNDGSFQMQEQENRFPVYDNPFGTPSAPGQWTLPDDFGQPGGRQSGKAFYGGMTAVRQTTAVAGIDINAEDARPVYNGGSREVVVALIDTGIDDTHEDLQGAIWVNEDEIAGNGVDDDGNGYIDDVYGWNFYHNNNRIYVGGSEDSHGTHAAGTIAANADNGVGIAGIVDSGNVKIMSLKALGGSDGSGTTASIIQAIRYAEANGTSICNLSLGSAANDRALYQAIANSSMLFVVAAGNESANTDTSPCYPAAYALDNIISVANLNYDRTIHDSSNYGASSVDLATPGSYVLSTTPGNEYSYMTGTSMAAPMVSAAAAMVYSHYEDITLADVKEILLSSTKALDSLAGNTLTGGMLDLGAAMSYDADDLSGEDWETVVMDAGSAPEISMEQSAQQGGRLLTARVTDADGDLTVTAYASGTLDAAQFQGGAVGRTFTLNRNGQAMFTVPSSGTFTFYACDSFGNETVKTVSVECDVQENIQLPQNGLGSQPGMPSGQPGGQNRGTPAGGFPLNWQRGSRGVG